MKGDTYTYSDLVRAWECPRAWSWYAQGYRHPVAPEAMLRGLLTHSAIAAHWVGANSLDALEAHYRDYLEGLKKMRVDGERPAKEAESARRVAIDLATRYIAKYGTSVQPVAVEELLIVAEPSGGAVGSIGGTPDLVAIAPSGQRVMVNFKTTGNVHLEVLDLTGQYDYYAYIWGLRRKPIDVLYFDVASPDYITRVERPPRPDRGKYLYRAAQVLSGMSLRWAQALPHFGYQCGGCQYLRPCRLYEGGGDPEELLLSEYALDEQGIGRHACRPEQESVKNETQ